MLGLVDDDHVSRLADLKHATIQFPHPRCIAGRETEHGFRRHIAQTGEHGDHPQNAERLHPRPRRRVCPENHPLRLPQFERCAHGQQAGTLIPVMDYLDAAPTLLAKTNDLVIREGSMATINMADDVGIGLQHHVLVDETGARDRRATGVNGALHTVFARPGNHLLRRIANLHRAEAHLAEKLNPSFREGFEILLHHTFFNHRRTGQDLYAGGAEIIVPTL